MQYTGRSEITTNIYPIATILVDDIPMDDNEDDVDRNNDNKNLRQTTTLNQKKTHQHRVIIKDFIVSMDYSGCLNKKKTVCIGLFKPWYNTTRYQ